MPELPPGASESVEAFLESDSPGETNVGRNGPKDPPLIPDYEVLRLIGSGSYGQVWIARSATGMLRAIKIVDRKSFDNDRPYEREFEGIKKFEPLSQARETQAAIFHVGRNDAQGFFYYVMELADPGEMKKEEVRMQNTQPARSSNPVSSFCILNSSFESYVPRTLKHDLRRRGALPVSECLEIGLSLAERWTIYIRMVWSTATSNRRTSFS